MGGANLGGVDQPGASVNGGIPNEVLFPAPDQEGREKDPALGDPIYDTGNEEISLPEFTPGEGINTVTEDQDKNGNTDETRNRVNDGQESPLAVQALMKAQGAASQNANPWWDPFDWFDSSGGGSTDDAQMGIVALVAALAAVYVFSQ